MCYDDHDYCLVCNKHTKVCWCYYWHGPPPEELEDLCHTPDGHSASKETEESQQHD